ncbi:hypothetical protein GEMRC1_012389 [Eukaryota sp. GEM-RC1]
MNGRFKEIESIGNLVCDIDPDQAVTHPVMLVEYNRRYNPCVRSHLFLLDYMFSNELINSTFHHVEIIKIGRIYWPTNSETCNIAWVFDYFDTIKSRIIERDRELCDCMQPDADHLSYPIDYPVPAADTETPLAADTVEPLAAATETLPAATETLPAATVKTPAAAFGKSMETSWLGAPKRVFKRTTPIKKTDTPIKKTGAIAELPPTENDLARPEPPKRSYTIPFENLVELSQSKLRLVEFEDRDTKTSVNKKEHKHSSKTLVRAALGMFMKHPQIVTPNARQKRIANTPNLLFIETRESIEPFR